MGPESPASLKLTGIFNEGGSRRTLVKATCVSVGTSPIDEKASHVVADISLRYAGAIKGGAETKLQVF